MNTTHFYDAQVADFSEIENSPEIIMNSDDDEETETDNEVEGDNTIFYFVVPTVDQKFKYKKHAKKHLQDNGLENAVVIRGRQLETKTKKIVKIDFV